MTRSRFFAACRLFFILWGIVVCMAAVAFFILVSRGCYDGPDA